MSPRKEYTPQVRTTGPIAQRFPTVRPPLLDLTYQERMYLLELQQYGCPMANYLTTFELRLLAAKILNLG